VQPFPGQEHVPPDWQTRRRMPGRYPRDPWMPEAAGALFLTQLIPSLDVATGGRIGSSRPTWRAGR